jgi:hypothetical protein
MVSGVAPPPRVDATLTAVGGALWLFGGLDPFGQYVPRGAVLSGGIMAYSISLSLCVCVGGGGPRPSDGLHELTVTAVEDAGIALRWIDHNATGARLGAWPAARHGHTAVAEGDGALLVYGGHGRDGRHGDVWRLDVGPWHSRRRPPTH